MNRSFKTTFFDFFRIFFKALFQEKVLARLTYNKTDKSFWIKLVPNNYQYPLNSIRYVNRKGINYKLDLHDYVDWWLFWGLKEESREKLYGLLKVGDTAIDIGTNIGET